MWSTLTLREGSQQVGKYYAEAVKQSPLLYTPRIKVAQVVPQPTAPIPIHPSLSHTRKWHTPEPYPTSNA